MAKPLRSDDPNPKPVQFAHFGVLDTGKRSKGAAITSITINVTIALIILVLGMVVKNNPQMAKKVEAMYLPPKPPEVPKPKPPPPPPPPKPLPTPPKIEPPKIKMPEPIKPPPEIKPVIVPEPKPVVITPPAPKKVDPPPAPKAVSLNVAKAAAVPNADRNPSAVRLGNDVIKVSNSPAVATKVNLGGGMAGMNASNTGAGKPTAVTIAGSGAPNGTNLNSRQPGAVVIKGLSNGVPGGTGTGRNGPVAVQIKPPAAATAPPPAQVAVRSVAHPPTVIYKPNPVYTEEAKNLHLQGAVQIKIRVGPDGSVQVIQVMSGLGHGLDESAKQAITATRFKPATDAAGQPIEWVGVVRVNFELS